MLTYFLHAVLTRVPSAVEELIASFGCATRKRPVIERGGVFRLSRTHGSEGVGVWGNAMRTSTKIRGKCGEVKGILCPTMPRGDRARLRNEGVATGGPISYSFVGSECRWDQGIQC